jgi:hypothetical protein
VTVDTYRVPCIISRVIRESEFDPGKNEVMPGRARGMDPVSPDILDRRIRDEDDPRAGRAWGYIDPMVKGIRPEVGIIYLYIYDLPASRALDPNRRV